MSGSLTTHVLDTASGRPASGVGIEVWRLADGRRERLGGARTNGDGRTDEPLLAGEALVPGVYELVFRLGPYFARCGHALPEPPFLDEVPLRVGIAEASARYHVPLLASPWAYSTYRGS